MTIRKLAAAAALACGAALAFAPLASADVDASALLGAEIASQNSIFELQALFTGVDVVKGTNGGYDSLKDVMTDAPRILPTDDSLDVPNDGGSYGDVTPLEYQIYGANPILAGISGNTGPYNELNGALTQLYNAYNVYANAAANNGMLDTDIHDYLGADATNTLAVAGPNATIASAEQFYLDRAFGDLKGFDAIFAPNATSAGDINPIISNEIVQLNNIYEFEGKLSLVYDDIAPHINSIPGNYVGFDTLDSADVNQNLLETFNSQIFGAASTGMESSSSFDVYNGALADFFNASNVGLYALLNNGDLLPGADIIGGATEATTVSGAITEFLTDGFKDLGGYFVSIVVNS